MSGTERAIVGNQEAARERDGSSTASTHGTKCVWCQPGQPAQEPGAHHAADCILYRSPYVGAGAAYWASRLREWLQEQDEVRAAKRQRYDDVDRIERLAAEEVTLP